MRARGTLWFIISTAASTIGCVDSVSPQDFVGEYVLTRIHGDRLPALIFNNTDPPGIVSEWPRVFADTIRLRADGTGSRTSVIFRAQTRTLTFKVTGGGLAITYVCPPNADCIPGPHAFAVKTAAGLNITHELSSARTPEEFVAVAR